MSRSAGRPFVTRVLAAVAAATLIGGVSACTGDEAAPMIIEDAWVRTTTDAKDTSMTAMFLTAVNPGTSAVTITKADCSSVAGVTQLHEMVTGADGKMVMQEAKGGIEVPAGQHVHLKPSGLHVMLMQLTQPLEVGDEVTCTLTFSSGDPQQVTAPVKKFTEEEDHYHPSPSTDG